MRGGMGGRRRSGYDEGRSAHSSLGCNWISAARAGRMFGPRSPCRGLLALSGFPTSLIRSRLSQLMGRFLHGRLRSPPVIYMSDYVCTNVLYMSMNLRTMSWWVEQKTKGTFCSRKKVYRWISSACVKAVHFFFIHLYIINILLCSILHCFTSMLCIHTPLIHSFYTPTTLELHLYLHINTLILYPCYTVITLILHCD